MSEWQTYKIKDIWRGFFDGPHATPPVSDNGGIFLGISNITSNGHIDLSDIKYISEQDLPKWTKRVVPQGGDIVFSYEATLNLYAIIPEGFHGCLGRRMALIRVNEKKASNKFLFYYFFSKEWRTTIAENTIVGSTVDRIPIAKFPDFPITLPPLDVQKKLASILSAYDNLIENNNKRIKILEQIAENLYKEWFVRFRFPGHETTSIENGIPNSWRIEKIENISNVTDGVHNTIQDTPDSPYLLLSCKNIKDGKIQIGKDERTIDEKTFFKLRKRTQLSKGDILITSVGTIGDIHLLNQEPSYIEFQRSVAIVKPNKELVNSCYLYEMFKSMRKEFENAAHGAAQQCLFIGDINRMKVSLPPLKISQLFGKKVQPIYDLILTLSNQCDNLIKQRDLLLPRLMSGKLAV